MVEHTNSLNIIVTILRTETIISRIFLVQTLHLVLQALPEPLLEQRQLGDQVSHGVHQGVVGGVV